MTNEIKFQCCQSLLYKYAGKGGNLTNLDTKEEATAFYKDMDQPEMKVMSMRTHYKSFNDNQTEITTTVINQNCDGLTLKGEELNSVRICAISAMEPMARYIITENFVKDYLRSENNMLHNPKDTKTRQTHQKLLRLQKNIIGGLFAFYKLEAPSNLFDGSGKIVDLYLDKDTDYLCFKLEKKNQTDGTIDIDIYNISLKNKGLFCKEIRGNNTIIAQNNTDAFFNLQTIEKAIKLEKTLMRNTPEAEKAKLELQKEYRSGKEHAFTLKYKDSAKTLIRLLNSDIKDLEAQLTNRGNLTSEQIQKMLNEYRNSREQKAGIKKADHKLSPEESLSRSVKMVISTPYLEDKLSSWNEQHNIYYTIPGKYKKELNKLEKESLSFNNKLTSVAKHYDRIQDEFDKTSNELVANMFKLYNAKDTLPLHQILPINNLRLNKNKTVFSFDYDNTTYSVNLIGNGITSYKKTEEVKTLARL